MTCAPSSAWPSFQPARRSPFMPSANAPAAWRLILDLRVRAVVAAFLFLMPVAGIVLVFDRGLSAWRALLGGCSRRGGMGCAAGGEGLGKDIADLVGPSAVMLDNGVSDTAHGALLRLWTVRFGQGRQPTRARTLHVAAPAPSCNQAAGCRERFSVRGAKRDLERRREAVRRMTQPRGDFRGEARIEGAEAIVPVIE